MHKHGNNIYWKSIRPGQRGEVWGGSVSTPKPHHIHPHQHTRTDTRTHTRAHVCSRTVSICVYRDSASLRHREEKHTSTSTMTFPCQRHKKHNTSKFTRGDLL